MKLSDTKVTIGNGGWIELRLSGRGPKPFTLVRFTVDATDELKVEEIYLAGKVTSPVLRFLDVARLEAIVNVANPELGELIRGRLQVVSPDMRGAASWYASTGRDLPVELARPWTNPHPTPTRALSLPSARLTIPSGNRLGEAFYRDLGTIWRRLDAAGVTEKNKAIADANGVDVGRVASWVKRARPVHIPRPDGKGTRS